MKTKFVMQKYKMITVIIITVCIMITFDCKNQVEMDDNLLIEMGVNGGQLSSLNLKGTQWKLAGLYHSETSFLRVIEPIECKECYTFTFTTDTSTIGGTKGDDYSFTLHISGNNIFAGGIDQAYLHGYPGLYQDWCKDVISYSISKSEIRLYTKVDSNYLLYKKFDSFQPKKEKIDDGQVDLNLKGTKWRWEGIYYSDSDSFYEPVVLDCDGCYELTFDTDSKAEGYLVTTPVSLIISEKYAEMTLQFGPIDEGMDIRDFTNFSKTTFAVISYNIDESELKLYTYNKNYLLFKKISQ